MASRALAPESADHRVMLRVLTAVKRGDFSVRMPMSSPGPAGQKAAPPNDNIQANPRPQPRPRPPHKDRGKEGPGKPARGRGSRGGGGANPQPSTHPRRGRG